MATPITSLLEEVSRNHFPYPPATPAQIEKFEQRAGWKLDPDLRAFSNSAGNSTVDSRVRAASSIEGSALRSHASPTVGPHLPYTDGSPWP